jgi:hypothetical protein
MIARLVKRAIREWQAWIIARRVERCNPELASLRKAEATARRQHKAVKHIHQTRRAIVHAALAAERKAS